MFDVICNDARKYFADTGKFETKADKQVKQRDVITIVQVKTNVNETRMVQVSTCKLEFTSNRR